MRRRFARPATKGLPFRPLLGVLVVVVTLSGCTSTVTPPVDPADPVTVYLVQEASHVGLVFPVGDGRWTEYGYGDWDWYAAMHTSWYHVFDTILWPTSGCLGRRRFETHGRFVAVHPPSNHAAIRVARADADALVASFERVFERHDADRLDNPTWRMTFVPADRGYWFGYNCYDAAADWLRALGCRVTCAPIRLGLAAP